MKRRINVLFAMRDQQTARSLQREMDDEENLSIAVVCSGDAAYESACRFRPDILVLEAALPGMDGPGVIDRLRGRYGGRMPRIVCGTATPFGQTAFIRRGAQGIVCLPWNRDELRAALCLQIEAFDAEIDWESARAAYPRACALLSQIGMKETLRGYAYLAWAAALARQNETRLWSVGERLYGPIAERFSTTPQSVERLIRHAVESTMDAAKSGAVYSFFGNTIDPTRGKPTNAQMLALLLQKMNL
ncbi:MAG: response regulator [Clostridia bacterium]|nr:response regulator [Clostridia bacterium]